MDHPAKKPHLVILVEVERIPIQGGCSSCKDVVFETGIDISTAQEHHDKLESLFQEHFRKVHMRENATHTATSA